MNSKLVVQKCRNSSVKQKRNYQTVQINSQELHQEHHLKAVNKHPTNNRKKFNNFKIKYTLMKKK